MEREIGMSGGASRIIRRFVALPLFALFGTISLVVGSAETPSWTQQFRASGPAATDVVATTNSTPQEAPAGFDGLPNDLTDSITHNMDAAVFSEVEGVSNGLGPVFNATSCVDCHQSPVAGGLSQVTELRVGHVDRHSRFTNPDVTIGDGTVTIPNRSLINDRAVCPSGDFPDKEAQERVPDGMNVRTLRTSLNTLGDGFIEAIASSTILDIAAKQCRQTDGRVCGQAILVSVSEAPGQLRIARFGWKNQHASLLSFSADAYLNEMGITSRLAPHDTVTAICKTTTDPENQEDSDGLADIDRFTRFMRATKAPARDGSLMNTLDAQAGAQVFDRIGCDTCHVQSIVTAPAGSVINGGAFIVPEALGNKIIHPYGDFLLHNVGTGDGIVQNGGPATAQKMRTPPLWGVRTRSRLLHDGRALTFNEAILEHGGEASGVVRSYRFLSDREQQQLIAFLKSL